MRKIRLILPILAAVVLASGALVAQSTQEKIDHEVYARIRAEALERSQVMQTLHVLTDVYGPRLTGSPSLKAASDWIVKQSTDWGLRNAHLEPWDFGRPGWSNERASAFLVAPVKDSLVFETLAWTPGTKGPVTASAVLIEPPARFTREQLTAYFEATRATVKGAHRPRRRTRQGHGDDQPTGQAARRCHGDDAVLVGHAAGWAGGTAAGPARTASRSSQGPAAG